MERRGRWPHWVRFALLMAVLIASSLGIALRLIPDTSTALALVLLVVATSAGAGTATSVYQLGLGE